MSEPNIILPPEAFAPDISVAAYGESPEDSFVVARNHDGTVASYISDFKWNWTAYHPHGKVVTLNFTRWCSNKPNRQQLVLVRDAQFLMFLMIWKRGGAPLSHTSIVQYVRLLNRLAEFCYSIELASIKSLLSDGKLLLTFYEDLPGLLCKWLSSLLSSLVQIGSKKVGFQVLGNTSKQALLKKIRLYSSTIKQTPPIPTRIYSSILQNLDCEIKDFCSVADRMFALVSACRTISSHGAKRRSRYANGMTFQELLDVHDLRDYFETKSLQHSTKGLSHALNLMRGTAGLIIQAFSGMRVEEVYSLPFDCLITEKRRGKTHYIIRGVTTKFNHGLLKETRWITSREGAYAIEAVQKLASFIARIASHSHGQDLTHDLFLFVSPSYLGLLGPVRLKGIKGKLHFVHPDMWELKPLINRIIPVIEEGDIRELEIIDPFRSWRTDDNFKVGKQWHFKTHQLRRSLALYASRSGYVSLPSLRRQLRHITEEMSSYYAKGSSFVINFIGDDKKHFGFEYQDTQPESQALSFIANVLMSEERLFGANGIWLSRRRGDATVLLEERNETIKLFKVGQLAYQETILGGCTKVTPCEKRALRWIPACLTCASFIGKPSKLQRVISAQEAMLNNLPPNTVEWRTEKLDLEALIAAQTKIKLSADKEHLK